MGIYQHTQKMHFSGRIDLLAFVALCADVIQKCGKESKSGGLGEKNVCHEKGPLDDWHPCYSVCNLLSIHSP